MDYSTFGAEDFLLDPFFVRWIRDGQNDEFWQAFMAEHPSRVEVIQQARLTILAVRALPVVALDDENRMEMWEGIEDKISRRGSSTARIRNLFTGTWRWAVAAMILAAVLVGWQLVQREESQRVSYEQLISVAKTERSQLVERVNNAATVLPVRLPDGSAVFLSQNSRISYSEDSFNGPKREVYFTGEAFFEVAKNPEKPFFVYSNELVTRVLGTSFTIRAFSDDKQVEVLVKTGKVSVFRSTMVPKDGNSAGGGNEGLVLMPNQRVTLQREGMTMFRTLVNQPEILLPDDKVLSTFEFDDELVGQIFLKLEKAYGVEIVYDEELFTDCRMTASLTHEPLYEKIRLICQGLGATYEVIDARVVIHSTGCK